MNRCRISVATLVLFLLVAGGVCAQTQRPTAVRPGEASPTVSRPVEPDSPGTGLTLAAGPQAVVPRLMKFSGALHDGTGKPLSGTVDVTFSLYSTEAGGEPLWFETQSVQADELGGYTALLGAMHTDGLPMDLFTSGEVRWLGVQVGLEAEQQPRVLLVSVPYALKAGDAETLGGKPASAYMLSDSQSASTTSTTGVTSATNTAQSGASGKTQKGRKANASPLVACPSLTSDGTATANSIALFTSACNIENSVITQVGGNVGIGTASPQTLLHLQNGSLMLRDGGAWPLTMEQSFGSVFVITNGGTNQMSFDYNGNLGVGTTSPLARVHIQNGSLILRDGGAWPLTMEQGFGSIFTITNGGNKQLAFDYNGNLGIGTTAPAAKLDVKGNLNVVSSASGGIALQVQATDLGSSNTAISGLADGSNGSGVVGQANNGATASGVWGISSSGWAGLFSGNLSVSGTISAGVKDFKIDHPIDPANKFLYHASVESSEMKTIYDGTATLDSKGEAMVQMPSWFEALNGEFHYQLTCVGGYAPIYIAQKIQKNTFKIAGGTPGLEVDWQVTGVRHDAYAQAHPLDVEVEKPENQRGYYLHPELFGQSPEKSLEWADHPEVMKRIRRSDNPKP
jgi:hypothetical protein